MLHEATIDALGQITALLDIVRRQPGDTIERLFVDAQIGAHTRHVHDHFDAFFLGCEHGTLDYNRRTRNSPAETDLQLCLREHRRIIGTLKNQAPHCSDLRVISEIDCRTSRNIELASTVDRELLYLINHTIHHVALISLKLSQHGIAVPPHLGLAPGTASYRRAVDEFAAAPAH